MVRVISMGPEYQQRVREAALKYFFLRLPEGCVTLKTCDRLEIYYTVHERGIDVDCVRHLFELCAGLKSPVLGENAVFHQVKCAYKRACEESQLDSEMHVLFQYAFRVGKAVRTQTNISKGAISHSLAAVNIIYREFSKRHKDKLRITLVGFGHLNSNVVKHLLSEKSLRNKKIEIYATARDFNRLFQKSKEFNIQCFEIDRLSEFVKKSDVIVCSTNSEDFLIKREMIGEDFKLFIDLSVPGDVEKSVRSMKNIAYYDNRDVEQSIQNNREVRLLESQKARLIIENEVEKFCKRECVPC